jgi:hypothetical protein
MATSTAVSTELRVPEAAVKEALLDPAGMVTAPGVVSALRVLVRLTTAGLETALVKVTVQVALCPAVSELGAQDNVDSCAGADTELPVTRVRVKVRVTPPALAVITAL